MLNKCLHNYNDDAIIQRILNASFVEFIGFNLKIEEVFPPIALYSKSRFHRVATNGTTTSSLFKLKAINFGEVDKPLICQLWTKYNKKYHRNRYFLMNFNLNCPKLADRTCLTFLMC